MRKGNWVRWIVIASMACAAAAAAPAADEAATPSQLVQTYDSLANTILAAKQTEWNLVYTILATTYGHAEATMNRTLAELGQGKDASADLETLAALVAEIGNEGDASIAAIRKRLVEGGHHHHASGEQQGQYDPGYVIVTRDAKKKLLDASKSIARMAKSPDAAALKTAWNEVTQEFQHLSEGAN